MESDFSNEGRQQFNQCFLNLVLPEAGIPWSAFLLDGHDTIGIAYIGEERLWDFLIR